MSRLTVTRDAAIVAGAASFVWLVLNELREQRPAGRPRATTVPARSAAGAADLPLLPPAPHGWLQPISRWRYQDAPRPALTGEASAYVRARAIDPAGMVARSRDDQLLLPGQPGYGTASSYFHVTADRDADTGVTDPVQIGHRRARAGRRG